MTATQDIFAMARKIAQSVVVTTVKLSDNAIAKIVVSTRARCAHQINVPNPCGIWVGVAFPLASAALQGLQI
jgi:hypothetical protein